MLVKSLALLATVNALKSDRGPTVFASDDGTIVSSFLAAAKSPAKANSKAKAGGRAKAAGTTFATPTKEILASPETVILVVDFQWDFMQGGKLELKGADKTYRGVVKKFVKLARKKGIVVVWSQDWHPAGHSSFVTSHKGKKVFQMIEMKRADGTKYDQMMWPEHCIQGSDGAKIAMDTKDELVVQKGTKKKFDSYSAFRDDGGQKTELDDKLKAKGYKNVITFGLASDVCVKETALHAIEYGYNSFTIKELSRGTHEIQGYTDETYDWNENYTKKNALVWSLKDVEAIVQAMPDKAASPANKKDAGICKSCDDKE